MVLSNRPHIALFAALAFSPFWASQGGAQPVPAATAHLGTWGVDLTGGDAKTRAGNDFNRFVNGHFEDNAIIPPDRARFGNFDILRIHADEQVREILETAAKTPTPATAKIGDLYAAFMDEARIEALGATPIAISLKEISDATSREALAALMGAPDRPHPELFSFQIEADEKSPDHYAVYCSTEGLGLPDKDYYLKPNFAEIRAKYQAYIAKMLALAGWPDPERAAKDVLALESKLAQVSWERAEFRDRDKTYNPVSPAELAGLAPGFAFAKEMQAAGLDKVGRVILSDKSAFSKKAVIFADTPLPTLKAWMAFGVADTMAPYLSKAFDEAHFEFRSRVLNGQPEQQARWKRGVTVVNDDLGELVGAIYVAKHFPPQSRAQMEALVSDLRTALAARISRLEWMSAETKVQAQTKLAKFKVKIGYPDHFRDYAEVEIHRDDLVGDVQRASAAEWFRNVKRLNGPVDRTEWGMTPQTVNAYYNSTFNEIVFPAAILQPPFFDPNADAAVNYGAIGTVIGHEISHGFDDQGRKSDGDGVLKDWWTPMDAERFNARAAKLGTQYDAIEPLPGEHINGKLTLGENIGDLGGINVAFEAYHTHLGGKATPNIDGLTGDQRFFMGYAQIWRTKTRDEALRQQLHTDPHAPAPARVNAIVRNVDGWYDAFGVKSGDKLYLSPADRVKIW